MLLSTSYLHLYAPDLPVCTTDPSARRRTLALGSSRSEQIKPIRVTMPYGDYEVIVSTDRIANFGCPHCGCDGVHRWGSANDRPRYRCTGCRKTFTPLTGTPLAGLHHPERWTDRAAALGTTITRPAELCCDGGSAITAFALAQAALNRLNARELPVTTDQAAFLTFAISRGRPTDTRITSIASSRVRSLLSSGCSHSAKNASIARFRTSARSKSSPAIAAAT